MTKQDLFTYLKGLLEAIDGTGVGYEDPAFKAVERWKNQVQDKARTGLPGAFIELNFDTITETTSKAGVKGTPGNYVETIIQNLSFTINIHLYDKTFEDNKTYSGVYDLEQLVYLALQGKRDSDFMTSLVRIGGAEEDELSNLANTIISFRTVITDDSAVTGRTIKATTKAPIVTRGTV